MGVVSLTVGKVDAGVTVLLTPDKRLIEFPSILLPPDIRSGSIVDINVSRNKSSEAAAERAFRDLQDQILSSFGTHSPSPPTLRVRNTTQTSVVLEWDPLQLATADLISLSLYRNGQKAGTIPKPLTMHTTKISGLAVDTEYTFHLVLRTTAGTYASPRITVRTHKMTDLSGITITTGILPSHVRENLLAVVERIGAKVVDGVRIDTTHFVTTEGRGVQWEKANELNIPVVRPEWVEACERAGRILGVTKFYLDAARVGALFDERPGTAGTVGSGSAPPPPPPPKEQKVQSPVQTRTEVTVEKPKEESPEPASGSEKEQQQQKEEGEKKADEQSSQSAEEKPLPSRPKVTVEDEKEEEEKEEEKEKEKAKAPAAEEKEGSSGDEKDGKSPGDSSFQDVAL
ncbi:uncharacterized protein CTHT_0012620 [Thermochaetoides thermophila DSM 1495]|uniref:Chitin biosynthesis protein n=1 Tax=Chaetomium thermophilum (strain DSM 1495 / CBS 144.50 / IMI 039719) TaxID=759272 RepID=G0S177_CHATD|nr:hypothetical protein CTHT_0012620 [Thermochaetoides thermophila DSM 1495]EGS22787.1 hypothetical protein CTHT_0012620 [Thermochaetoides thermophila DSM 1495]